MLRRLSESNSIFLDLIRGISAQLVLIGHGIFLFDLFDWDRTISMQEIAVLIFFILSGFIISYSSFSKKLNGYGFKRYFIDRFSRIYPPLFLGLVFALIVDNIIIYFAPSEYPYYDHFNLTSFFGTLFNLEGFPIISKSFDIEPFGTARPTWSLAIEWWLYMAFGYFFFIIHKIKKIKWHHAILFLFLMLSPVANIVSKSALTISWILGSIIFYCFNKTKFFFLVSVF